MSRKHTFAAIFAGVTACSLIGDYFGYPIWHAVFFTGMLFIATCIEELKDN